MLVAAETSLFPYTCILALQGLDRISNLVRATGKRTTVTMTFRDVQTLIAYVGLI